MRMLIILLVLVALIIVIFASSDSRRPTGASTSDSQSQPDSSNDPESPSRAEALLTTMREGTWSGRRWPAVDWSDVPALLALADSDVPLRSFPVNPLSSQSQAECSTGMLALWLIEGVRLDTSFGYPSLNPLCFGGPETDGEDWIVRSERNRARAARAYRDWWQRVRQRSPEERGAIAPLADTGLAWYGSAAR